VESPFDVLDLDPDADDATVERAYRSRILEAHPDHGGTVREFQRVRRAYEEIQAGWTPGENGNGESVPEPAPPAEPEEPVPGTADADADADAESEDESEPEPDGPRVEYLDYDVLDDMGWDLGDEDLFEKAEAAGLETADYGEFVADPDETLLEAAEGNGFTWPYACRGGACTNCAVAIVEGEMPMPSNHVLPPSMIDRGIRLSCLSAPTSDEAKVIFNVKHLPGLDDLLLPASRFDKARMND
jgi:ferredoxin